MNRIEANIAGTKIPLKVSEEEEVYVTKAIEEINARIKQYQSEGSSGLYIDGLAHLRCRLS